MAKKKSKTYVTQPAKQNSRYGTVAVMDSTTVTKMSMPYIHVSAAGCGAHKTDRQPSRARRKALERKEYGI